MALYNSAAFVNFMSRVTIMINIYITHISFLLKVNQSSKDIIIVLSLLKSHIKINNHHEPADTIINASAYYR